MGVYKYIREAWKKPKKNMPEVMKTRLIAWRKEGASERIERPTRLDKARSLGYRAKPGFIIIRQKVSRSARRRPKSWKKGKRTKHSSLRIDLNKSYQQIAEERSQKKHINTTVLNSYWVAEDGKYGWYEVILVDPHHPVIMSDPKYNWTANKKARVFHGQTSAGKRGRDMS